MKRILEVNYRDRYAVVEPGVVNLWLTNHLKPHGYHFAPDPSSQGACTIGGNVATNSGGPHTLKYGVTVNHVLGVEFVLPDGRVVHTGGPTEDNPGYDLTGVMVGSEGTFGIVTKVWVRITRNPEAYRTLLGVFETVDDATNTISDIIGAGIVPAALEMLDQLILQAVEAAFHFGFPLDAGAVLIMEVDGLEAGLDAEAERIDRHRPQEQRPRGAPGQHRRGAAAAVEVPQAGLRRRRPAGSELLHAGRRGAAHQAAAHPARRSMRIGEQVRPAHRQRLPRRRRQHPSDPAVRRTRRRIRCSGCWRPATKSWRSASAFGGSVTGEHGIGVEKIDFMPKLFTPEDLAHDAAAAARRSIRTTAAAPHKMLPTAGACIEPSKAGRRAAL